MIIMIVYKYKIQQHIVLQQPYKTKQLDDRI
eukprot:UN08581